MIFVACTFAQVRFDGEVHSPNHAPLAGVRVQIRSDMGISLQTFSNPQGRFLFELPSRGSYQIDAEREGYYPVRSERIAIETAGSEMVLTLEPVREHTESIEVRASPPAIDMDTSSSQRRLTSRDLSNIPYPNTNDLRSALRTVPGVVRDSRGGLHVNGASEEQVLFTLNGFNANDPLNGRFESRVGVESVRDVEVTSGNLAAEFGKGSGGVMAVESRVGGDHLRPSATNFFPGFENRKGWTLGDWTPRFGLAGPILRGRTWFSESVDLQYVKTVIRELPAGQDRASASRLSNLLHLQHNLRPGQVLSGGILTNAANAARTGLSALDTLETTVDRRSRQWFAHLKDQVQLGRGALLEAGFASNRTFGREIPQGNSFMEYTADGKRGNFFIDGVRRGERNQALVNLFPPSFSRAGNHQLKTGVDLDRVAYWQDIRRTGFENFNEAGLRTTRTVFAGNGRFSKSNWEVSSYVQDTWRIRPGLLIETGIRADWDALLRRATPSPRLGVAWSPKGSPDTRLYGGFARIADALNLRLFTRPLDQYTLTTNFRADGDPGSGPSLTIFTIRNPHPLRPRFDNWYLGGAHRWARGVTVRADYVRRRGGNGFTYRNAVTDGDAPPPEWAAYTGARTAGAVYTLTNERTDSFDSASLTVRGSFSGKYEWLASYTRSRATSNTAVDITVEDPITIRDTAGPMPWDTPHRLLSWAYLALPLKDWAVSYLLDARSGFPFSVQNDSGAIVGGVNSRRFPFFFEFNLHLERRFVFRGHRWAFRFGSNDLTNRINPDTVNTMAGSSRFLHFYGGNGRTFNFRIRWLGRAPA